MPRPTIRTVQVRARDLVEGDVMLHTTTRPTARPEIWRVVRSVSPLSFGEPDRVRVDYTHDNATVHQAYALVTIQKEIPS